VQLQTLENLLDEGMSDDSADGAFFHLNIFVPAGRGVRPCDNNTAMSKGSCAALLNLF